MYKIYINETPLMLTQFDQLNTQDIDLDKNLLFRYNGRPRSLLNPIDMMEKTRRYDSVIVYYPDLHQLKKDFKSLYKIIEAAGGVVYNEKGEILTMFRLNSWDLPKGKIDEGETKEAAAIREVQEETGLSIINLGDFLCETFHTYKNRKGKRVLKRTYWYLMSTKEHLIEPQIEENIELVEWLKPTDFLEKTPIYNTIKEVVKQAINRV